MRRSQPTGGGLFAASRVAVAAAIAASLAGAFWAGTQTRYLHLLVGEPAVAEETADGASPSIDRERTTGASATVPTLSTSSTAGLPDVDHAESRTSPGGEPTIDASASVEKAAHAIAPLATDAPAFIEEPSVVVASLGAASRPAEASLLLTTTADRTSAPRRARETPPARILDLDAMAITLEAGRIGSENEDNTRDGAAETLDQAKRSESDPVESSNVGRGSTDSDNVESANDERVNERAGDDATAGLLKALTPDDDDYLAPITLLPPIPEEAPYRPDDAPRFFDAATLCKQLGGSASEYLDLGCRALMMQSYTAVDPDCTDCRLFVFDMGGQAGAETIYGRQRGGIVLTASIGDAGHRFGATWFFRQGPYYIVIANTDEGRAADRFSKQLARGLSERVRSSLARAEALRRGPPLSIAEK